jgi:hypothetical protein
VSSNLPAVRKVLFIGMNNPKGNEPLWPRPYNTAGHRLSRLIREAVGWEMDDYIARTDRVNFCDGLHWTMDRAKERLGELQAMVAGRRTICVGVPAAVLMQAPYGDDGWYQWDGLIAAMPHTSPFNRYWNNKDDWGRAVQFLREVLT